MDSPQPRKRSDFAAMEEYVKHLETELEFCKMRDAMRVMERKMGEMKKTLKSGIPNGNRFVTSSVPDISYVLTNGDANSDSVSISEDVNVITTERY